MWRQGKLPAEQADGEDFSPLGARRASAISACDGVERGLPVMIRAAARSPLPNISVGNGAQGSLVRSPAPSRQLSQVSQAGLNPAS